MTENKPVAYIAGKITGDPLYRQKFKAMEERLAGKYTVLNPAVLPAGLPYEQYFPITIMMIAAADIMFILPGSDESAGVLAEVAFAKVQGKKIVYM